MTPRRLLLWGLLLVATSGFCQNPLSFKVSFAIEDTTASAALLTLSRQTGVTIAFSDRFFPEGARMGGRFQNTSLGDILHELLMDFPVGYKALNGQVVLFPEAHEYSVSGYVEDEESGERLMGATVADITSGRGTSSNEYGFYSLRLPAGQAKIRFTYIGYESKTLNVKVREKATLNASLIPETELPEVVITPTTRDSANGTYASEPHRIPVEQMEMLPKLGGEADLFRMIQTMPGVESGADGWGGLQIRGSESDQNMVLYDDAPLYYPSHGIGLFSTFNPDIIKSTRLYKGDFPARYGGRGAAVMDIRTAEGNLRKWGGQGSVGLLAARLAVEGPIWKDRGAVLLTARRSIVEPLLAMATQDSRKRRGEKGYADYIFYDFNVKAHFKISNKDKIFLSAYYGTDGFYDLNTQLFHDTGTLVLSKPLYELSEARINWSNRLLSLRWNHQFSNQFFVNHIVVFSKFKYKNNSTWRISEEDDTLFKPYDETRVNSSSSSISNMSLRSDFEWYPNNPKHHLRFGYNASYETFNPLFYSYSIKTDSLRDDNVFPDDTIQIKPIEALNFSAYVEDEIRLNKTEFRLGVYAGGFSLGGKTWYTLEPRISIRHHFNSSWALFGAVTGATQFVRVLSAQDVDLPSDIWVPATPRLRPLRVWQASIGADWRFREGFMFTTEAYGKYMNGLIEYRETQRVIKGGPFDNSAGGSADTWEDDVVLGNGWAYGIEFSLKKTMGKTTGWFSYTLARSIRQFDSLNLDSARIGQIYPFRFDRRHSFKLSVLHKLNSKWSFSASYALSAGDAVTIIDSKDYLDIVDLTNGNNFMGAKSDINGFRQPWYHRLDIGVNLTLQGKYARHEMSIGVYNAYNATNRLYTYRKVDPSFSETPKIQRINALPILPYFNYSIKF